MLCDDKMSSDVINMQPLSARKHYLQSMRQEKMRAIDEWATDTISPLFPAPIVKEGNIKNNKSKRKSVNKKVKKKQVLKDVDEAIDHDDVHDIVDDKPKDELKDIIGVNSTIEVKKEKELDVVMEVKKKAGIRVNKAKKAQIKRINRAPSSDIKIDIDDYPKEDDNTHDDDELLSEHDGGVDDDNQVEREHRKKKTLKHYLREYKRKHPECDPASIVEEFFPTKYRDGFCYYDLCDYTIRNISLGLADFRFAFPLPPEFDLQRTQFEYENCDNPFLQRTGLLYYPLYPSNYSNNDICPTVDDVPQNPLITQVTIPADYFPNTPLKLRLNILLLPPTKAFIERQRWKYPELFAKEKTKIKCNIKPEETSITVSGDVLGLCDKRVVKDVLGEGKKCDNKLRVFGQSCRFIIYDYDFPVNQAFKQIQVEIILRPEEYCLILPQDLLVLQISRNALGGIDSELPIGIASGLLEYKAGPITYEDVVKKVYGDCETCDLDMCLNTFTNDGCADVALPVCYTNQ